MQKLEWGISLKIRLQLVSSPIVLQEKTETTKAIVGNYLIAQAKGVSKSNMGMHKASRCMRKTTKAEKGVKCALFRLGSRDTRLYGSAQELCSGVTVDSVWGIIYVIEMELELVACLART